MMNNEPKIELKKVKAPVISIYDTNRVEYQKDQNIVVPVPVNGE
jgi:ribosomal protein S2